MGFIEKNLANNEHIIYRANLHWWIYLKSVLIIASGIVIGIITKENEFGLSVCGLFTVAGIIGFINAYAKASSSEFAVTNRRIILKTGMLKRRLIELQLNRAEGLTVDQTIMGRILGYGDISVTSGGVSETFTPIAKPYEFKRQINNAIEGSFTAIQNPATL